MKCEYRCRRFLMLKLGGEASTCIRSTRLEFGRILWWWVVADNLRFRMNLYSPLEFVIMMSKLSSKTAFVQIMKKTECGNCLEVDKPRLSASPWPCINVLNSFNITCLPFNFAFLNEFNHVWMMRPARHHRNYHLFAIWYLQSVCILSGVW